MALTHHTGIPRPLNAGCSPRVIISVSNNPFCLGSSVTFTPTITCLETANIASYAWIVNGNIVSASGDPYTTTELTNNDSVYLLVIGTNGISYFSNVIYMIVTSDGCITNIKYGLLYNWYAATDVRGITSSDDWIVPDIEQLRELLISAGANVIIVNENYSYVEEPNIAGSKLKEIGTTYWKTPNTNATNELNFNLRGGSYRVNNNGFFWQAKEKAYLWGTTKYPSNTNRIILTASYDSETATEGYSPISSGYSIRLVYIGAGTPTSYTGNDGKIYEVVLIGTQYWLASNLAETKFRNGDYLHGYEGGSYQAISDANWSALVSEGVCCYNDDINLI